MVRHTSEFEPGDWSDPRSRPGASDEVPRWLVILGAGAGAAIVVALMRFAVDLLGLVSIIVLVGFSIRTLTDWLTDTETVSGWSLVAVLAGAVGTAATGLWLFGSSGANRLYSVEQHLPPGLARGVAWAEDRGWGGRVLLPDTSPRSTRTTTAPAAGDLVTPSAPASAAPAPAQPQVRAGRGGRPAASQEVPSAAPNVQDGEHQAGGSPAVPPVSPEPDAGGPLGERYPTAIRLTISPARSVVGLSVRLTAVVVSHTGVPVPEGTVVFRRGSVIVGSAPLQAEGSQGVARLSTVDLPVGTHELVAEYVGHRSFVMSRSAVVEQIVVRE